MVPLFSVGVGGGEEVLCGAEGTEAVAAGGSILLGAHSFLLLLVAAGKREAASEARRGSNETKPFPLGLLGQQPNVAGRVVARHKPTKLAATNLL
nr:unnamed protein product [Digitaria exilis]